MIPETDQHFLAADIQWLLDLEEYKRLMDEENKLLHNERIERSHEIFEANNR